MADNEFLTGYLSGQNEGGNKGGMFGGGWEGLLGLIVVAALFGGGGWGFGGGGNRGGCGSGGYPCATQADVRAAVDQQTLISKLDQQTYGIADATYSLNNTINSGFYGVDRSLCNLGYQLQQCCCDNRAAISDLKYTIATEDCATRNLMQSNTRDIIDAQNAGTRAILDFMVQEKLSSKDATIAQLQNQVAIANQNATTRALIEASTAEILRKTGHECPTAAYIVQPPTPVNFPVNGCGTVQFGGYGNGCGCCAA